MALESQVVPAPTLAAPRNLREALVLALAYGRKLHKADQKFSQWCKEQGFGDIASKNRADAMWLAAEWSVVTTDLPVDLTHPQNIRQWHREQATTSILPADLAAVEVTQETGLTRCGWCRCRTVRHRGVQRLDTSGNPCGCNVVGR